MKLRTILMFLLISEVAIVVPAVTIGTPQVLPETSANGPAIVFSSKLTLLIAWTGSWNQQLNFQRRIGAVWQAKVTTGETSPASPALTFYYGRYYVAWIGVGNLQLNVMSSADGVTWSGKQTFGSTSKSSPSLAVFGTRLYLIWRDNLNDQIDYVTSWNGTNWGGTAGTYGETTMSGQALAVKSAQLLLAWRGVGNNQLNVNRGNGSVMGAKVTLGDTTTERPALVVRGPNEVILAWQGVGNNQLNTIVSTDGGASFGGKFTSGETSLGGPALAATSGSAVVAWTGTDPAHHLNVAWLGP
jgi:hypothetical protein